MITVVSLNEGEKAMKAGFKRDPGEDSPAVSKTHTGNHNDNPLEAYVIVTIGKKHFLTRFASYMPATVSAPILNVTSGRPVERVIMKMKPVRGVKKAEDFTIKPAPTE